MLAHFSHHLLTTLPAPLLPFIRKDFNLDYTQSALVITAFSLAYGIGQIPAGWLADRVGRRAPLAVGILGVALVGVLVGISQTYIMMVASLILMGLVGGGYHPAATPLISASVEPKNRGRALGFHVIGGSAAFFVAPMVAGAIAAAWGWRGSFLGLAVPTAALGIIFFLLLRRQTVGDQLQRATTSHQEETPPSSGHWRRLIAFMVLVVIGSGMNYSATAFLPLYAVDNFGLSEQLAASLLSVVNSAGLWAGPVGGYLSDRLGRTPIILATYIASGIFIFLLRTIPYGAGFWALLLFIGMNNFIRFPVAESFIIGQTAPRHRSTVYGIYYFAQQEASAVFAPLMGYLIDRWGFQTSFTIASATVIAITLICSLFLWGKD